MQQIFLHRIIGAFLVLFFAASTSLQSASVLRYVFGSAPIDQIQVQEIAQEADKISDFKTPTFKMNWLAKKLGCSSFNWFNTTWVDEEAIKNNPKMRTLWQLLHEKYHTIGGHDWRRIIGAGAVAMPILRGIVDASAEAINGGDFPIIPYIIPWALPQFTLAIFLFLWHEEYCERQADIYADEMLELA